MGSMPLEHGYWNATKTLELEVLDQFKERAAPQRGGGAFHHYSLLPGWLHRDREVKDSGGEENGACESSLHLHKYNMGCPCSIAGKS